MKKKILSGIASIAVACGAFALAMPVAQASGDKPPAEACPDAWANTVGSCVKSVKYTGKEIIFAKDMPFTTGDAKNRYYLRAEDGVSELKNFTGFPKFYHNPSSGVTPDARIKGFVTKKKDGTAVRMSLSSQEGILSVTSDGVGSPIRPAYTHLVADWSEIPSGKQTVYLRIGDKIGLHVRLVGPITMDFQREPKPEPDTGDTTDPAVDGSDAGDKPDTGDATKPGDVTDPAVDGSDAGEKPGSGDATKPGDVTDPAVDGSDAGDKPGSGLDKKPGSGTVEKPAKDPKVADKKKTQTSASKTVKTSDTKSAAKKPSSGKPHLAKTGSESATLALVAFVVLAFGAGIVGLRRRQE